MKHEKSAGLAEVAPEKVAQWRSTVRDFFSASWAEVQEVIEALEAERDELPPPAPPAVQAAPRPASAASAPPEPARPEPTKPNKPIPSGKLSKPQRDSTAAPARSGLPQDARLAELARRIEERLRQSKS